jgi:hypothetical protein
VTNRQRAAAVVATAAVVTGTVLVLRSARTTVFLPVIGWQRIEAQVVPQRGAALTTNDCGDVAIVGAGWWFNWGTNAGGCAASGFVPMVWGRIATVPVLSDSGAWLMGFNEPNYKAQSELTPTEAAAMWPLLEETGRRLTTPAVSACEWLGNPACLNRQWLEQFIAECDGCRFDALALHWYGCSALDLFTYLDGRHRQYPTLPIWLTEFGCPSYAGDPVAFMRDAVPMLRRLPYVHRYAAFATRTGDWPEMPPLVDDGELTAVGREYVQ